MSSKRKPNGYWTKEKCQEVALLCNRKCDFEKKYKSAYTKSLNNGWIDEICYHMNITKEKCFKIASEYEYKTDFIRDNWNIYYVCCKNDWLYDVCKNLKLKQKPKKYWTFEKCKEEALKYKSKSEFQKKGKGAYTVSLKNKWLDKICTHMISGRKPNGYWCFEKCKEEALKYETKTDFLTKSKSAYSKSLSKKWIDEICKHMIVKGNHYKRCIYVFEFTNKIFYVGLTYNIHKRKDEHFRKGPVYNYYKKVNIKPKMIQLTDYINIEEAKIKEKYYLNKYLDDGWIMLNSNETGGIGGGKINKYSDEELQKEALKYKTRKEFMLKNSKMYNVAKKRKIIKDICKHMIYLNKPNGYWTFEKCKEEALKYNSIKDFKKYSSGAHYRCKVNNWLDIFFL
jgi:predicted GIY-YIG superfamily endonuclease